MTTITKIDWQYLKEQLNDRGHVHIPQVLSEKDCIDLRGDYDNEKLYRNVIKMERYRFGRGEYKYFQYPLPAIVETVRREFYPQLSAVANEWMKDLGLKINYPNDHEEFIRHCHDKNQKRPTPLILKYETGGYNTLHQDLYGEVYFPFQVVFLISQPVKDFTGGEFVLMEQVPRTQSRAEVLQMALGDALIFTTNFRPVKGTRGYYRVKVKHGISEVKSGTRHALGVIFHDAG